MVSPSLLIMGKGDFFPKNYFHWGTNFVGKIYREIVLHGGLMIGGKEFLKMHFPVI